MAKDITYTNEKKYSISIAVWLADDLYDHAPVEGPYMSVTGLLKPIKQIILGQRLKTLAVTTDIAEEIDIDRWVASRLGTAIHSAIEHSWTRQAGKLKAYVIALQRLRYPPEVINLIQVNPTDEYLKANPKTIPVYMEQRAYKKILGYTIGGMYDFIGQGTLEDFKSMGSWGYMKGDKDYDFLMQGSMYKWLNPDKVTDTHMRIQQIITDWNKLDAQIKAKQNYPPNRIVEKVLKLKTPEEIEVWITDRLTQIISLKDTPEPDLPKCTQKELWQDPPKYNYYGITKKGVLSKVATKKFYGDQAGAYAFMNNEKGGVGEVREMSAKIKRCGYCDCRDICSDFAMYTAAGIVQMP